METFDTIRDKGLLLFEYIRGSHCHGLATPSSDIDMGGVFISPKDDLLDLGFNYQDQISNESNDIVWYDLKKFMTLLLKSNPTILEALFVDDKYVKYEHPLFKKIREHRDLFLTKKCFPSFFAYARSQVEKAKGLNKMINWERDKIQRKGILDFTYTFYKQGSTKIANWLEYRGLDQKYCGLVNIPNMRDIYGVYYDWGNFFQHEGITVEDLIDAWMDKDLQDTKTIVEKLKTAKGEEKCLLEEQLKKSHLSNMVDFIIDFYFADAQDLETFLIKEWYEKLKPIGYSGMVGKKSQELRLSSVSKGEKPICYVSFNKDGYIKHCKDYKNYQDWIKHRNPIRYESNLHKSYDAKNMCECFRLIHCGIEIAEGKGYIVDRSGIDADFLLDIKNHKFEYDYLIEKLEEEKEKMNKAMETSTLKEDIDPMFVNSLYVNMVDAFFKKS